MAEAPLPGSPAPIKPLPTRAEAIVPLKTSCAKNCSGLHTRPARSAMRSSVFRFLRPGVCRRDPGFEPPASGKLSICVNSSSVFFDGFILFLLPSDFGRLAQSDARSMHARQYRKYRFPGPTRGDAFAAAERVGSRRAGVKAPLRFPRPMVVVSDVARPSPHRGSKSGRRSRPSTALLPTRAPSRHATEARPSFRPCRPARIHWPGSLGFQRQFAGVRCHHDVRFATRSAVSFTRHGGASPRGSRKRCAERAELDLMAVRSGYRIQLHTSFHQSRNQGVLPGGRSQKLPQSKLASPSLYLTETTSAGTGNQPPESSARDVCIR